MDRTIYSKDEEGVLLAALSAGAAPRCPRCDRALDSRPIEPREGIAYVRRRTLYLCGTCGASLVVDRPRP